MKYTEFKNLLENDKVYPIYLFEGEDAFFREKGANLLKSKFVAEPEINCANFDGEKALDKEIVASLVQYPFISRYRMTIIREYYPKKTSISKEFLELLENPVGSSILVIINEKPSELFKKFSSVCLVECNRADATMISRWIKATCQANSVEIDLETANLLANYCALDMVRVENETQKLISYCYEEKVIKREDVANLVTKDTEYKIYEMTDFIAKKQFDQALVTIQDMLSKGETLQHLFVSIYNYFRRLLHVAISNKTNAELSKMLDIKEGAVAKIKAQAKMFTKRALKKAVDMLVDTDFLIKSGMAEADNKIWLTIFTIMTEEGK